MQFEKDSIYHIYNRGNQQQKIFFKTENYFYFLRKIKNFLLPHADFLAWCLMPNHFHFLIHANEETCRLVRHTPIPINALTEGKRLLLSSYTLGIQRQESFTGSLFQQKTKSKCVDEYTMTTFNYIHQNPQKAKLVLSPEDWTFSSLTEYADPSPNGLCDQALCFKLLGLDRETILREAGAAISIDLEKHIF